MTDIAPWEEFRNKEKAPWERETVPPKISSGNIIDFVEEQHPDISFKERAIIKNFAQGPEAGVKYIQENHPDLEVRTDGNRYFMRRKGTTDKFNVLDPNTGMFSKDIFGDITDIGYDLLAGGAETAASIGGALGGAALSAPLGGAGAIPGAMAGSGAASYLTEGARQKIGQMAGLPQEVSHEDMLLSGGIGAASPLMFGTGASGKQLAKAGVKKGLQDFTERGIAGKAKDVLSKTGGGVYQTLAKDLPARAAEVMSGISSKVYRDYIENPKIIRAIDEAQGLGGYAEKKIRDLYSRLTKEKDKISKAYEDVKDLDVDVDISGVKNQILDLRNSVMSSGAENGLNKDQLKLVNDLDTMYSDLFDVTKLKKTKRGIKTTPEELGSTVKMKKALELKKVLKKYEDNYSDMTRSNKSAFDKAVVTKARGLNSEIAQKMDEAHPMTGAVANAWKDVLDDYEFIETELKNKMKYDPKFRKEHVFDKKGKKYLKSAGIDSEEGADKMLRLQEMDEKYGSDLTKSADMLKAYDQLRTAPWWPLSGGATSTTRTIGGAALGGLAGSQEGHPVLGATVGALAGSPKVWKGVMKTGATLPQLSEFLGKKQMVSPQIKQSLIRSGTQSMRPRKDQ